MPTFGSFQFAPSDAGDWTKYAGFNRTTGQMTWLDDTPTMPQAGVAPPKNMSEYMDSKIAPVQQKLQAVIPAAMQLSQGNVMQAKQTLQGAKTQPATPAAPAAPASGYDYTFGLE